MSKCDECDYFWYAATNEDGWRCCSCDHKPGEPPGFDPARDRAEIRLKVWCILSDLVEAEIVHVSNSSHGDAISSAVATECENLGLFDSYTIARLILEGMTKSHAEYWKKISEGVLAGADPRNRCHCGKLANCSTSQKGGGWIYTCSEHWSVR